MPEPMPRKILAQYLSDWTLVRLPDGRVGVFTRRADLGRVTFPGRTGVDIALDIELDIVKHPAEMAAEAMAQYYAAPSG